MYGFKIKVGQKKLLTNSYKLFVVGVTTGLIAGQTVVSSDITSQYSKLSGPYGQGFILETFKGVPGVGKMGWSASESPYQAIYSRPNGLVNVYFHCN